MVGIRRLEEKDIRAIFECLREGRAPPAHLPFQIVPVGIKGSIISPPAYAFPGRWKPALESMPHSGLHLLTTFLICAVGLYVLLRPHSNSRSSDGPQAPSHLKHLVWAEAEIPAESCRWYISGPQYHQPTVIQQRYCYPKGRLEYTNGKGGALWTMYNTLGKEDTEYRLLHV